MVSLQLSGNQGDFYRSDDEDLLSGELMDPFDVSTGGDLMGSFQGPDSTEARNTFRQLQTIDDSRSRGLYDESADISRAMWDDWSAHGRTTLATLGDELKERSTEAHAARAAGLAAADVNQAFDTETANLRRDLQRYGINPGSGRAMAGLRGLSLGRSGALAGAQTRSRMSEEQRLFNDRLNFVTTLDNSGKMASAAASGLAGAASGHAGLDAARASRIATSAQGLAGIDASERSSMLGDLNARRNLLSAREGRSLADLNARRDLLSDREARSLADINAQRQMEMEMADLDFRERDAQRRSADTRYAADRSYDASANAARKQASSQKSSSIWGALGSIGGAVIGGLFSDRRMKTDIEPIGELPNGLKIYQFRFHGEDDLRTGVMADEVEKVTPQFVGERDGYQTVDYNGLFHHMMAEAA